MNRGFIIVILVAQSLLFFIHYVFYRYGIQIFPRLARHSFAYGTILTFLSISFLVSMILVRYAENKLTQMFYHGASIWIGTVLWVLIALLIARAAQFFIPNTSYTYLLIPQLLLISAFFVSAYGLYHGRDTKIVQKDITISNLPREWDGKRAAFIADTHYGNIRTVRYAQEDARIIQSLKPDILLVSGDFFDGPQKDFNALAKPYTEINPPLGKYIISGNHESYAGLIETNRALAAAGFTLLDSQHLTVKGVEFTGVPYTTNTESAIDDETTARAAATTAPAQTPRILLKHVPIATDIMKDAEITFAFFGHTHRGQMWPFSLITKKIYKEHAYGFTQKGNTLFYTTSGVGSWGPPQRIGTDSEVLVVTFHTQ